MTKAPVYQVVAIWVMLKVIQPTWLGSIEHYLSGLIYFYMQSKYVFGIWLVHFLCVLSFTTFNSLLTSNKEKPTQYHWKHINSELAKMQYQTLSAGRLWTLRGLLSNFIQTCIGYNLRWVNWCMQHQEVHRLGRHKLSFYVLHTDYWHP